MTPTAPPVPTRRQARTLVLSTGVFWFLFAVSALAAAHHLELGVFAFPPMMVAGTTLYLTLFEVWRPVSGVPGWQLMFTYSRAGSRTKVRAMMCLVRPSWLRIALRATGWPVAMVTLALAALLSLDLVELVVLWNAAPLS